MLGANHVLYKTISSKSLTEKIIMVKYFFLGYVVLFLSIQRKNYVFALFAVTKSDLCTFAFKMSSTYVIMWCTMNYHLGKLKKFQLQ